MARRLRMAVVGLGAAGRHHCQAMVEAVPQMHLAAVVEAAPEVAESVSTRYGVPAFGSCRELIRSGVCEAVTLATPHTCHAEVAVECLRAGLHVLCEKPLAESVAQADRMLRTARSAKRTLGCILQERFNPNFREARRLVRSGRLGQLMRATLIHRDFRTQTYYDSNVWGATWKGEGGGVLLNQAPHHLDWLTQLAGCPKCVTGRLATRLHRIEVEDQADALLTFASGATGYVLCSTCEPTHGNYLEIAGDRGRLVLDDDRLDVAVYGRGLRNLAARSRQMWCRPEARALKAGVRGCKTNHAMAMCDFARHVLHGSALVCDAASALASLELANAVVLSHFTGASVHLPTPRKSYAALLVRLQAASKPKQHVRVQRTTDPRMKR